ncbi:helix-turn-helix domain-containing protein [Phocaeicola sp.]|uniref:helix-turn-helix domain-containing protein n=1 Tax=Phocaeicola sp. TaxID=2773926 RepID=UPI0023C7A906|nr:helix-turn-helix domain-containing protein [Phocaeicola sp.]MDE5677835.1 helix-turn-helix domain-containing protein [Phocaeicola sp.]
MDELINSIAETIADQIVNRVLEKVEQSSQSINVNNIGMKLYTTKQLCEMLHISKAKLYRHREQGYLRPTKYVGRTPLYDQAAIDAYLNNFSN